MLSEEAAKKKLDGFKTSYEKQHKAICRRIRDLPTDIRRFAWAVLGHDAAGEALKYEVRDSTLAGTWWEFDQLTPVERRPVWDLFFPKMAGSVESAWVCLQSQVYQPGSYIQPARAPRHPGWSLKRRCEILHCLGGDAIEFRSDVVDMPWLAAWCPHAAYSFETAHYGALLAAVIDSNGPDSNDVLNILIESLTNQHEIGRMGEHAIVALLSSSRPEGWHAVEQLLLSAQRQEGLRSAILQEVPRAHPKAVSRILRLVLEHKLLRFEGVSYSMVRLIRSRVDAENSERGYETLRRALAILDDPGLRDQHLAGDDPETIHFSLMAMYLEDAPRTLPVIERLIAHASPAVRAVALGCAGDLECGDARALAEPAIDDEHLTVAVMAARTLGGDSCDQNGEPEPRRFKPMLDAAYPRLERLYVRLPPAKTPLPKLSWQPFEPQFDRRSLIDLLLMCLRGRCVADLLKFRDDLTPSKRQAMIDLVKAKPNWTDAEHDMVVEFAGDSSKDIRGSAFETLAGRPVRPQEAPKLEELLSRKAPDIQICALWRLLELPDPEANASADRLVVSKNATQRRLGQEMADKLVKENRRGKAVPVDTPKKTKERTKKESSRNALKDTDSNEPTLEEGLGFLDRTKLSRGAPPVARKVELFTPAVKACLISLDALIHEHRKDQVTIDNEWCPGVYALGKMTREFPGLNLEMPVEPQFEELPLRELWESWVANRPDNLRDPDGQELSRLRMVDTLFRSREAGIIASWINRNALKKKLSRRIIGDPDLPKLKYENLVWKIINYLAFEAGQSAASERWRLDWTESAVVTAIEFANEIPPKNKRESNKPNELVMWENAKPHEWYNSPFCRLWIEELETVGPNVDSELVARKWRLACWLDRETGEPIFHRPSRDLTLAAFDAGLANLDDLAHYFFGKFSWKLGVFELLRDYSEITQFTARYPKPRVAGFLARHPAARDFVERIRQQLLDTELARGALPTRSTSAVDYVGAFFGIDTMLRIVAAIGDEPFSVESEGERVGVLSGILQSSYPADHDTPESFSKTLAPLLKQGVVTEERLLALAIVAPQWIDFVAKTLDCPGLREAIVWFVAFMKNPHQLIGRLINNVDAFREPVEDFEFSRWNRVISSRTRPSEFQIDDGYVDRDWFSRVHAEFGDKRWRQLTKAMAGVAKGEMSRAAVRISETLRGERQRADLMVAVMDKKDKEAVRLLGLLPFGSKPERDADLRERYDTLIAYRAHANSLGMARADAMKAFEIGVLHLAQTAGFADPLRLEWAMEHERVADLAAGPVTLTIDDATVSLELDDQAEPVLVCRRGDKRLKAIPPAIKKVPAVAALVARASGIRKGSSRIRKSLEAAMSRGDAFSASEVAALARHGLIAPVWSRLVLIGEPGERQAIGYPVDQGKALQDFQGKRRRIAAGESLRIAHTYDLYARGDWPAWQRECVQSQRRQPFKQLFRELYLVSQAERDEAELSYRYAGQQVDESQAFALWTSRDWIIDDVIHKTFHAERVTCWVRLARSTFEMASVTLDEVSFSGWSDGSLPLDKVPPRVFSEAMRDLDLVVSVAHRGKVDPEVASQSTLEMRSALIRETCQLAGIENVELSGRHAMIRGNLGCYQVHLASGTIQRLPGQSVCILPVHAQYRGRLFLPFADDDPKTAEILSKILLLANDGDIVDPTILSQLTS